MIQGSAHMNSERILILHEWKAAKSHFCDVKKANKSAGPNYHHSVSTTSLFAFSVMFRGLLCQPSE